MDCSLPVSSIHRFLQARRLEWVAITFSRGSSQPRDRTSLMSPSLAGGLFTTVVVQLPSHVRLFVTPWTAAARPPCPSPSPRVCPSSCSLHLRCHPAISFSDAHFSALSLSQLSLVAISAAELLQLCPTLCDPLDCSPPGSSVQWIL